MTTERGEQDRPIRETAEGVLLHLHVVPRSSKCQVTGCQGGFLKVKITAPPVEGRANEECIRFLADLLRIKKEQIRIVGGLKSRNKTLMIRGVKKSAVESIL